jgi:AcrR family transcriptional regulator
MSRTKRLTRKDFITGMFAALDRGHYDVSLTDLCKTLDVTTGSFYSHFADMPELHSAVTEIWRRNRIAALPDMSGDGVHEPLDILRKIREAASDAAELDSTIRRWAATANPGSAVGVKAPAWARSAPAVAAAVAEVDQVIADYLTRAVTDLGFTGAEATAVASWLAAGLQVAARARDREGFETVLNVLARAEAFTAQGPEVTSTTAAEPDAVRIYATARELPEAERRLLGDVARRLAAGRSEGEPQLGQDRAEAGQG